MISLTDPSLFRQAFYLNGAWQEAGNDAIEVVNPATGAVIGRVPKASQDDTRRAIEAANDAFPEWAARPARERSAIMRRWFELIVENADDLACILTAKQGKPLQRREAKYSMALPSSNGSQRTPSGYRARPFLHRHGISGCWYSASRSAFVLPSPRGTFPWQ